MFAQDKKQWYVLRQDPEAQSRVVLEYYKDERAASKGDAPKGVINIRDVVLVHRYRVADKKQSFEILCPGIGYRLMANSELEADEWTSAIQSHICYKRDDGIGTRINPYPHSLDETHGTVGMSERLPTPPPDSIPSLPSSPHLHPNYWSLDLLTPSNSSDSSSVCSGSSTSVEAGGIESSEFWYRG